MRFMMLMIPGGYNDATPGTMPDPAEVTKMMAYNQALNDAGILLSADGLHPPSMGARVSFADGTATVHDGPFAEAKEVLGGYWMLQVRSRAEAIEWARRCPARPEDVIEIRQVQDISEFPEDIQRAAADLQLGKD
ncbi:MAG: YciI family protein [Gammaproteobacteria bacterium]|nr:YciI family protein [Myxococcales bacterium]MCB1742154.1 YciI family protein [Gammaproteobacteria bacterium]